MEALWQKASDRLKDRLGQVGFETWISPLHFLGIHSKTATLQAPNKFFRDWVNERYAELLRQSLSAEAGENLDVMLIFYNCGPRIRTIPPTIPPIQLAAGGSGSTPAAPW